MLPIQDFVNVERTFNHANFYKPLTGADIAGQIISFAQSCYIPLDELQPALTDFIQNPFHWGNMKQLLGLFDKLHSQTSGNSIRNNLGVIITEITRFYLENKKYYLAISLVDEAIGLRSPQHTWVDNVYNRMLDDEQIDSREVYDFTSFIYFRIRLLVNDWGRQAELEEKETARWHERRNAAYQQMIDDFLEATSACHWEEFKVLKPLVIDIIVGFRYNHQKLHPLLKNPKEWSEPNLSKFLEFVERLIRTTFMFREEIALGLSVEEDYKDDEARYFAWLITFNKDSEVAEDIITHTKNVFKYIGIEIKDRHLAKLLFSDKEKEA